MLKRKMFLGSYADSLPAFNVGMHGQCFVARERSDVTVQQKKGF